VRHWVGAPRSHASRNGIFPVDAVQRAETAHPRIAIAELADEVKALIEIGQRRKTQRGDDAISALETLETPERDRLAEMLGRLDELKQQRTLTLLENPFLCPVIANVLSKVGSMSPDRREQEIFSYMTGIHGLYQLYTLYTPSNTRFHAGFDMLPSRPSKKEQPPSLDAKFEATASREQRMECKKQSVRNLGIEPRAPRHSLQMATENFTTKPITHWM
jgi:hypothetical protein